MIMEIKDIVSNSHFYLLALELILFFFAILSAKFGIAVHTVC